MRTQWFASQMVGGRRRFHSSMGITAISSSLMASLHSIRARKESRGMIRTSESRSSPCPNHDAQKNRCDESHRFEVEIHRSPIFSGRDAHAIRVSFPPRFTRNKVPRHQIVFPVKDSSQIIAARRSFIGASNPASNPGTPLSF